MAENEINLTDVIAPNYYNVHHHIINNDYTSYWLRGGRGSLKSSFAAIEIILGIIQDSRANALAVRKYGNTIRDTVMETFLWAIDFLKLNEYFSYTYSPAQIIYTPTGQKIRMTGLDDPRKLKSIRVKHGYFKFLWFEEAEEYTNEAEMRSVRQSVFRGSDHFVEFVSFNPPLDPDEWINIAANDDDVPDRFVHDSNYLEVPPEWLGKQFLKEAAELKRKHPLLYEHEYMGISTGVAGEVFNWAWFQVHDYLAPFNGFERIVHSWDTAYKADQHNDPSACTVWGIKENKAYLLHVLNERMEYPALKQAVLQMHKDYPASAILVEDKSSGQSLIQELRVHTNLPVIPIKINPGQDKIARASSCTGIIESGKVFVPKSGQWLSKYKNQLVRFTFDKDLQKKNHDDMVDSTSQFLNWWINEDNNTSTLALWKELYGI
jgi:PBSX family phage terminase large subunit